MRPVLEQSRNVKERRAPRRDPGSGEIPMRPNAWPEDAFPFEAYASEAEGGRGTNIGKNKMIDIRTISSRLPGKERTAADYLTQG